MTRDERLLWRQENELGRLELNLPKDGELPYGGKWLAGIDPKKRLADLKRAIDLQERAIARTKDRINSQRMEGTMTKERLAAMLDGQKIELEMDE
jgi:uncharacterized coiled-coil protein SlyX